MSADLHAALAAVREVVNLHRPDGEGWCVEDGFSWPCATARTVSLVLDSDDAHPATDADRIADECGLCHCGDGLCRCEYPEPARCNLRHRPTAADADRIAGSSQSGKGFVPITCGTCGESVPNPAFEVHECQADIRNSGTVTARADRIAEEEA